jgi:hypothetical protein
METAQRTALCGNRFERVSGPRRSAFIDQDDIFGTMKKLKQCFEPTRLFVSGKKRITTHSEY